MNKRKNYIKRKQRKIDLSKYFLEDEISKFEYYVKHTYCGLTTPKVLEDWVNLYNLQINEL